MNIFFLDENLDKSVYYHCDKHVVKMRIELTQMLCTCYNLTTGNSPYKTTHINHPCSLWIRESLSNYLYTLDFAFKLCDELKYRFNTKDQKVLIVLNWLKNNEVNLVDIGFTVPKLAMDNQFILFGTNNFKSIVKNYRNYYKFGKNNLHKWTKRDKPYFI